LTICSVLHSSAWVVLAMNTSRPQFGQVNFSSSENPAGGHWTSLGMSKKCAMVNSMPEQTKLPTLLRASTGLAAAKHLADTTGQLAQKKTG